MYKKNCVYRTPYQFLVVQDKYDIKWRTSILSFRTPKEELEYVSDKVNKVAGMLNEKCIMMQSKWPLLSNYGPWHFSVDTLSSLACLFWAYKQKWYVRKIFAQLFIYRCKRVMTQNYWPRERSNKNLTK